MKPLDNHRLSALSRRRLLGLAGTAGAAALLGRFALADEHVHEHSAAGAAAPERSFVLPERRKLKLAINLNAVCLAPVAVAESQGFFSKHNLDVEFVNFGNSTEVLLEAIATGKADAGVGMALRWLKALEQGFDVKLTAGTHGGCLRLLTAANGGASNLEALKGKTIGVTDMASPDKNFFSIMLKRHGVDPVRDVEWRQYPADLLGTALDKGEVQAVSGSDPFMYRLLKGGDFVELSTNLAEEYGQLSCCVVGVTGTLARQDKAAAAALTQAILEAHSWAAAHPDVVAQDFLKYAVNTSPEEIAAILKDHTHAHHASGPAFVKEIAYYARDLKDVDVLRPSTDPQKFAESIYVDVFS
ncbi:ABC transporter substrate-binding protein [Pseudomonas sp. UBA6310]|uniref:ABC transporter substrate-binding protein n=1 Tax=Pseudomonas sp. UBA6310 TaxID=1947327 RepID=UPI00257DF96B|nr:ABC transporter substrate-binding protein [Pseudomonas sp. UBA6310]